MADTDGNHSSGYPATPFLTIFLKCNIDPMTSAPKNARRASTVCSRAMSAARILRAGDDIAGPLEGICGGRDAMDDVGGQQQSKAVAVGNTAEDGSSSSFAALLGSRPSDRSRTVRDRGLRACSSRAYYRGKDAKVRRHDEFDFNILDIRGAFLEFISARVCK